MALTTPDDWFPVLADKLDARASRIEHLRSYSNGEAPLPEMGRNLRASWQRFQRKSRTNFGGLAVESVASRVIPNGVRIGDNEQAPALVAARRIYRDNRLDVQIRDAIRDYLTTSIAYLLAGDEDGKAVITREMPEYFITATDPLRPWRARSALKAWRDEDEGVDYALVWANGERQKYWRPATKLQASGGRKAKFWDKITGNTWEPDGDPDAYKGDPPVITLERLDGLGLFESHTDLIDRINLGKLQRLVTTAMQAFRQRGIKGDLPTHDDDGNAINWAKVFEPAPGALWDLPAGIDVWESQSTDIRPLLEGEKVDAGDFAAVLRLPISLFVPENQSAAGALGDQDGLYSQARDEIARIRPGLAVAFVYALRIEGIDLGDETIEVLFEPPDRVTPAEKYAAAVSAKAAGLASRTIKRDILGMSPDQIKQDETDFAAEQLAALTLVTTAGDAGTVSAEQSADVKARADAMGVLIRSGVEPGDAARQVGFDGMNFTGAVPVTLRVPERDSVGLEDK